MKQFTIKLISFVLLFLILIFITTFLSNKLINNANYYKLSDTTKFVVFGNSHSECAFNDSLIRNFKNLGNSGESYFYTYLKVKKIISSNRQIKNVFIEFTNNMIEKSIDSWTFDDTYLPIRIPTYFPLMDYSDFRLIWTYNYKGFLNCVPKSILKNIGRNFKYVLCAEKGFNKEAHFGGYLYLVRDKTDSLVNNPPISNLNEKTKSEISEINIKYLVKTIEFCKLNNVKVFLIRSPLHSKYTGNENKIKFRELLRFQLINSEFLDFKDFPLQNYEFGDLEHLNYKGARIFSIFFNNLLDLNLLNKNNKQDFINNEISKLSFSEPSNNVVTKNHINKMTFK